ncbi:ParB/RepB/Spo0J family partition protein [Arthrobacter sp. CAN_A2]|uniref:ParB/RepB/Spo0J family partition protein n=1 Tax=Arthrobacter sp. CAN_A2 TaxID=2787718 RepID=UPI002FF351D1
MPTAAGGSSEGTTPVVEGAHADGTNDDTSPSVGLPSSGEGEDASSSGTTKRQPDSGEVSAGAAGDVTVHGPDSAVDRGPTPAIEAHAPTPRVSRETASASAPPSTGERAEPADGLIDVPGARFAELSLDSIHPNRKQPRVEFNEDELAELVHSIREIGVLQPVVVRPSKEEGDAPYELVMGERRLRASREAGMETIPAIIRSTLDDDLLRDALLENLHRSALNPLEEAAAYQQLLDDFGCSHDELAGRLGRSRPQISNTLRLMKLPPLVQRRLAAGILSAGHARALLGLADAAEMEKLAQRIVAEGLSVRSTEEIVALSGGLRRPTKTATPKDGARHERLDYLATSLSDRLDTNVKITLGAKKGRVSIEFASVDDLNRIIGVLSPSKD